MGVQPREAARARSKFADGRLRLALTTERAHFFLRIRTRGVKARFIQMWSGMSRFGWLWWMGSSMCTQPLNEPSQTGLVYLASISL